MERSSIQLGNTNGIAHTLSMELPSAKLPKHSLDNADEQTDSLSSGVESVHDQELILSDSESGSSGANSGQFPGFCDELVRLFEGDRIHDIIKQKFLSALGSLGNETTVVTVHKNRYSSIIEQARMQSFQIFTKATEKCRGSANVKYAWFGATVDETCNIMKNGFGRQINDNNGLYGCGIYLSPDDSPLET